MISFRFDVVNINLMHKPEWYFVKNPLGKVPAVQQGDFLEVESLNINDALEKRYPAVKLWPSDEESQQKQKTFLEVFDEKVRLLFLQMGPFKLDTKLF